MLCLVGRRLSRSLGVMKRQRGTRAQWSLVALAGLVLGIGATIGFDTWARISVSAMGAEQALSESIAKALDYPFQSIFLAVPFVGAALIAHAAARQRTVPRAILVFLLTNAVLSWLYWRGFIN